jgi:hypothetical protein
MGLCLVVHHNRNDGIMGAEGQASTATIEGQHTMTTTPEDADRHSRVQPLYFQRLAVEEQLRRASSFFQAMSARRTIRSFSPEPVPFELIEMAIKTAMTAPSGANQQPWRFGPCRSKSFDDTLTWS